ncbi:MAG TPA: GNAT family N-acetyltransferase, partial [Candidatus Lustribacter sp.]|nr:GNAT family N-acetyltransferase [Candidatus Lustribacter sp.]
RVGMQIHKIAWSDEATLRQFYEILNASQSHGRVHFVGRPFEEALSEWRQDGVDDQTALVGLWAKGKLAGVAHAWLPPEGSGGAVSAQVDVHPRWRGLGYGHQLFDALVDLGRQRGATLILAEAKYPAAQGETHPYRLFLEGIGMELTTAQLILELTLPVAPGHLDRLETQAKGEFGEQYRISTWGAIPDDILPSLCELMSFVEAEAPAGRGWHADGVSPESYLSEIAHNALSGRRRLTSLATELSTGAVVGFTEMLTQDGITRAHQWGTYVHPDHRGHQLGMAVKAASARRLQEVRTDCVGVLTSGQTTPGMAAVNARLGFVPAEVRAAFVRTL